MNCPRCSSPLHPRVKKGVEIDYCNSCGGIWLDAGELDKIVQRSGKGSPQFQQQHKEKKDSWIENVFDVFDF